MNRERRCPKCNYLLKKSVRKCPICDLKLPKERKDSIEPFPSIIETPNRILNSESLDITSELKLKPIPLKVKPVTSPKEDKEEIEEVKLNKKEKKVKEPKVSKQQPKQEQLVINEEIETLEPLPPIETKPIVENKKKEKTKKEKKPKKEKTSKFSFLGFLKAIVVIILVCINIYLLTNIIINYKDNPDKKEENKITAPKEENHTTTELLGKWQSSNNGLFVFEDNLSFYWYEYFDDLENNYYSGTYSYKKGQEALIEMGYTEAEFTKTFGTEIQIDNVYSLNLVPKYAYKAKMDVTASELTKDESWWYLLMIKDDGTALGYNKTLDLRYNLKVSK